MKNEEKDGLKLVSYIAYIAVVLLLIPGIVALIPDLVPRFESVLVAGLFLGMLLGAASFASFLVASKYNKLQRPLFKNAGFLASLLAIIITFIYIILGVVIFSSISRDLPK